MITEQDIARQIHGETQFRSIEDHGGAMLIINLMRWLGLEVMSLFVGPVQVIVLLALILYPLSC